ncbi:MAG TPA: tetratricopeptide repeat protein [Terriglobia bacterium]|nr:tetratricopeptide repeat protein [Terriglobia bacterium]
MSRLGKWMGGALVLVVMAAAAPAWAQTGGVTGKTILSDGSPCVKCMVVIDRQDIKGHYEVKTDKKGEYTYIGLPIGRYKLTLQDPSGHVLPAPGFFIARSVDVGDPTQIDFNLPKEIKRQQASPEAQKQIEEQQKEQKQMTNLKEVFNQGQQLYNDKKYAEAAAAFEQGIPLAKDKNLLVVKEHLADSYRMAKNYDKAVALYQDLITSSPTEAGFHNDLGSCYADMGKSADAEAEFQKAAELNPASAGLYYYNLGVIMVNTGKMDDATVALKKATDALSSAPDTDSTKANAYYWYGMALLGKAQYKPDGTIVPAPGTVEAFQTYLKIAPNGPWASAAQQTVAQLGGKIETQFKKTKKKG